MVKLTLRVWPKFRLFITCLDTSVGQIETAIQGVRVGRRKIALTQTQNGAGKERNVPIHSRRFVELQ